MSVDGVCDLCGNSSSLEDAKLIFDSYQEDWEKAAHLMTSRKFKEAEMVSVIFIFFLTWILFYSFIY